MAITGVELLTRPFKETGQIFQKDYWYYEPGGCQGEISYQAIYLFFVNKVLKIPYYDGSKELELQIVRLDKGWSEVLTLTTGELTDDAIFEPSGYITWEARKTLRMVEASDGIACMERVLAEQKREMDRAKSEYDSARSLVSMTNRHLAMIKERVAEKETA